jgi:hypothetical protein
LAKVKQHVAQAPYLSFTTDAWSSKDQSHQLLSLTAHFINDEFEPCYFVLGTSSIVGRHTSENLMAILSESLQNFSIESNRVHVILRDAAANMRKMTSLLNVCAMDCFAHRLQLVLTY